MNGAQYKVAGSEKKTYPRANKLALWIFIERYEMKGRCLEAVVDLHETEYMMCGKEEVSEASIPDRGLRDRLLNVDHPV